MLIACMKSALKHDAMLPILKWETFWFGRRKYDDFVSIDWHKKRFFYRCDTLKVVGIPLEDMRADEITHKSPGVVIMKTGWKDMYFLKEREGWTEDQYFMFADFKMDELGIVP